MDGDWCVGQKSMKLIGKQECDVENVAECNQFTTKPWVHNMAGFVRLEVDVNWLVLSAAMKMI